MLTYKYLKQNVKFDTVLSEADKKALLKENKDKNYSYYCILEQLLGNKNITPRELLNNYSFGFNLFVS